MINPTIYRSVDSDTKRVLDFANSQGWECSLTRSHHLRFTKSGARTVFHSFAPGDHRAGRNVIAKLKRAQREAQQQ